MSLWSAERAPILLARVNDGDRLPLGGLGRHQAADDGAPPPTALSFCFRQRPTR
jgi:hypothetical protein